MNAVRPDGTGGATGLGPLLFTVDAVFVLEGRPGPLLAPGVAQADALSALAVGTALVLVAPDGVRTATQVTAIELLHHGAAPRPSRQHRSA